MATRAKKQQAFQEQENLIKAGSIKAGPLGSQEIKFKPPSVAQKIGLPILQGIGNIKTGFSNLMGNIGSAISPAPIQSPLPTRKPMPTSTPRPLPTSTPTPSPTPTMSPVMRIAKQIIPSIPVDLSGIIKTIPRVTATPTARPTPVPDQYEKTTMETFDNYKVPREVAYGIAQAEGGRIGKNNRFNIGAGDANPQNAWNFETPLHEATVAAKLLSGQSDARYAETQKYLKDPDGYLKAVENANYAGDPKTWKIRSAKQGGAGNIYNSWSDFVKNTAAWKKWYKKY